MGFACFLSGFLAIKQALRVENRGQSQLLSKEYTLLCTKLRTEIANLSSSADPELLIALWSTDQLSHEGGVEYAHSGRPPGSTES